jgi:TRAP-type C4-dicarboxylate transport system permease large subunit
MGLTIIAKGSREHTILSLLAYLWSFSQALSWPGGVAKRMSIFAYILVGPLPEACYREQYRIDVFRRVSGSAVADVILHRFDHDSDDGSERLRQELLRGVTGFATRASLFPPPHMVIYAMVAAGVGRKTVSRRVSRHRRVSLSLSLFYRPKTEYPSKNARLKGGVKMLVDSVRLWRPSSSWWHRAGIFTATEASAVSVMYAAFLGFVIYRN